MCVTRHAELSPAIERNPTQGLIESWGRLWEVQKRLGAFFNADPGNLFLRANVTEALNEIILGMPLQPGREILLSAYEYGAIQNICRYRCEKEKRSLRQFQLPSLASEAMTEEFLFSSVVDQLKPERP